jgi:hypothetical protein
VIVPSAVLKQGWLLCNAACLIVWLFTFTPDHTRHDVG